MSMPFICGGAPSSLTEPEILPSPAALTFWPRINAAQQTRTTTDSTATKLCRFLIRSLLKEHGTECCSELRCLWLSRRRIWINRFQAELFRHFFFFALLGHERAQIENQVPRLVGLDIVSEGRHGSAIQAGHEDAVNILIGVAAFGPGAVCEVEGCDRTSEIILKGCSRRPVGHALHAVALPALHPGKYVAACLDALSSDGRFGRDRNGRSRLFVGPAGREVFHPGHEVGALLLSEGAPLRHVRTIEAAGDGVEKILVGGQGSRRSGSALEYAQLEVAGLGVNPGETLAVSIAQRAMANYAVAAVVTLGVLGMAGDVSDVAFRAQACVDVIRRELRR